MKLEAGKWYNDRSGMRWHVDWVGKEWACGHSENGVCMCWHADGRRFCELRQDALDLVSEWTEPPPVGSSAWANSLPVGTKVRWREWNKGEHVTRTSDGWSRSHQALMFPSQPGGPHPDTKGWCLYPGPKLRPWRMDEVPLGAWLKMEGKAGRYLITGAKEVDFVVAGVGGISYEYASDTCKVSTDNGVTWKPCGVEE